MNHLKMFGSLLEWKVKWTFRILREERGMQWKGDKNMVFLTRDFEWFIFKLFKPEFKT